MVTLREYLYGPWKVNGRGEGLSVPIWVNVLTQLTGSVEQYVLNAATDGDLRARLRSVRTAFGSAQGELELWRAADEFSELVKTCQDRVANTSRAQSQDLYRILATLNEALLLLAAGSTRTVGRLKQLEVSLECATSLSDMTALKSRLAEILALVKEEVRQERSDSQRERNEIEQQMKQIRSGAAWLRSDFPGREEATAAIERMSQSTTVQPATQFCVIVLVLSRIREIVRRYGDSAASNLGTELIHRRLHFPEGEPITFRWSPETLLICLRWTDGIERLNALLEPQIENPFEHRLFLGSRVAVLRVGLHWVVMPISGPSTELIEEIDRFTKGHA